MQAIFDAVTNGLPFILAATTATASKHTPVYVRRFSWLATLLLASAPLLLTGTLLALQLRCTLRPTCCVTSPA